MIRKHKKESILLACLYALSILLAVLFCVNSPVKYGEMLIDSLIYALTSLAISTAGVLLLSKHKKIDAIAVYFKNIAEQIKQNKKKLLITLSIALGAALLALAAELAISALAYSAHFIWQRFLFICVLLLSALFIYIFRGKPDKTFLCLSLAIGALMSLTTPVSYSNWDEDSHYPWAVQQSTPYRTYFTEADTDVRSIPRDDYFNRETRLQGLNGKDEENKIFFGALYRSYSQLYSHLSHIPSGIAIYLGRCLGLAWASVFIMGRLGNLLAYTAAVYFAIRRIKYGKHIIAVFGLVPTVLFLASNYSYDAWVIAWLLLGFSYFLRELQQQGIKANRKSLAIMLLAFVVGLGPKPIYFPLMFMLFFIGRKKFGGGKECRAYRLALSASIIFVVVSFMLPFLIRPEGFSDHRGGDNIDAVSQIMWVFANPLKFAGILLGFLRDYLSFPKAAGYLTQYGHLGGFNSLYMYMIVFIAAVVLTDYNKRFEAMNKRLRITAAAGFLFSVVLVTASLYASINPVGAEEILWVQPRYLLPLLCPVLLVVRSGAVHNKMNKSHYSGMVFGPSAFFLLSSYWAICIRHYN